MAMDEAFIRGAIFGGIGAAVAVTMLALLHKPMNCPKCKTELPKFRKPANFRQAMWGGYTCTGCGTELTRKGKLRES